MRIAAVTGALALVFTGVMGFAHTPAGRPILKLLGMGCPVRAKPEQIQAGMQKGLAELRGSTLAPERPALGLNLDATSLAQAERWAGERGLQCEELKQGLSALRCGHVPAGTLGQDADAADELRLTFSQADRLIAVDVYRSQRSSAQAAAQYARTRAALASELGQATEELGQGTAEYLAGGTMHLAQLRYRYRDYLAQVTAANLGERGVSERELFQSASF